MQDSSQLTAWLTRTAGPNVGKRHLIRGPALVVGRDPQCEINPYGDESAFVSSRHAEIRLADGVFQLIDRDSTNGTFVNGEQITSVVLEPGDIVRFGSSGPEYHFDLVDSEGIALGATMVAPRLGEIIESESDAKPDTVREEALTEAVRQARQARQAGLGGQTTQLMRHVINSALNHSQRKHRQVIGALVAVLIATLGASFWRISNLKYEKRDIDQQISAIEGQIEEGGLKDEDLEQLIGRLGEYQRQALNLQNSVFYKLGVKGREEAFIQKEIRELMAEFGAEQYSIPPEFTGQVRVYVERYQTVNRGVIERALGSRRDDLLTMQEIFRQASLPPDLVYMVAVESSFLSQQQSSRGAVGWWQFTPSTARAYGLTVNGNVDERRDLVKSTEAAARYVRALILEFGAGSSVMLALAAYNGGPGKVKRAVRRVEDPIKQRNFWYLYRIRAIPRETREYVPKIVAAIIVGRNLDEFDF